MPERQRAFNDEVNRILLKRKLTGKVLFLGGEVGPSLPSLQAHPQSSGEMVQVWIILLARGTQ